MPAPTTTSLRLNRVIGAPRDLVFEAWTRPEHVRKWTCPEDAHVAAVDIDLSVGGRFRLRMEGTEGQAYTAFGVYREIDPPPSHRIHMGLGGGGASRG